MVFLSLRATFTQADMKQDRARKCADQEVMERQTEKWYGIVYGSKNREVRAFQHKHANLIHLFRKREKVLWDIF
jgi:hypothetical protein